MVPSPFFEGHHCHPVRERQCICLIVGDKDGAGVVHPQNLTQLLSNFKPSMGIHIGKRFIQEQQVLDWEPKISLAPLAAADRQTIDVEVDYLTELTPTSSINSCTLLC